MAAAATAFALHAREAVIWLRAGDRSDEVVGVGRVDVESVEFAGRLLRTREVASGPRLCVDGIDVFVEVRKVDVVSALVSVRLVR